MGEFFAGSRVAEITAPRIREFFAQRQLRAVPNATINRSLALLRRMFRLAFQDGSLRVVPHFPMLKENNVRKGFVVHDQYTLLRDALPDYQWMSPATRPGLCSIATTSLTSAT